MRHMSSMASRRRRGERGSALVLAILILFAMLGLGLLAMRTATQNVAGSGNLRLNKQARYVAETGLSAVIAAMRGNAGLETTLLGSWHAASAAGPAAIVVDHTGSARVVRLDEAGEPVGGPLTQVQLRVAPLLDRGPNPLGLAGQAGALRTSYEVRIEGMKRWGNTSSDVNNEEGDCLMHFVARGTIASRTVDEDGFEAARDDVRFAEHTLRAGVIIPVERPETCLSLTRGGAAP